MWAAGLNPYEQLSPEESSYVAPWFKQYGLYMKAKNLGIKISPNDIDLETLDNLSLIHTSINEVLDRKRNRKRK